MSPDEFLHWENTTWDTIDFKKVYVDIAGSLVAGLMLSEIVYWHLPSKKGGSKMRVSKDGHEWIACRRYEWWDRCRISPDEADAGLKELIKRGIVVKTRKRFNGLVTVHIRLVWEQFMTLLNSAITTPATNPHIPKSARDEIGIGEMAESGLGKNSNSDWGFFPIPLTETTATVTAKDNNTFGKKEHLPCVINPDFSNPLEDVDVPLDELPKTQINKFFAGEDQDLTRVEKHGTAENFVQAVITPGVETYPVYVQHTLDHICWRTGWIPPKYKPRDRKSEAWCSGILAIQTAYDIGLVDHTIESLGWYLEETKYRHRGINTPMALLEAVQFFDTEMRCNTPRWLEAVGKSEIAVYGHSGKT